MRCRVAAIGLAALVLASPARAQSAACGAPAPRDDGWTVAAPAAVGFDPARLCGIPARVADGATNIHAVLVVRHGKLVFEQYFAGEDERFGAPLGQVSFDAETKHDLRSISKSVTSLLLGVALAHRKIASIDARVLDLLPEYADLRTAEKARIGLLDLLTMASGLAWEESTRPYTDPENSYIRTFWVPDFDRFVLEQPVETTPGERFNYNTGGTDLIGTIIQKATGQQIDVFAWVVLFEPLGITDFEWLGGEGGPRAGDGLRLRPRDLAKPGQLVLQHGRWHGRQIVPAAWIKDSTAPQITATGALFYGYQWWLGRSLIRHREIDWIAGSGLGGQRLYIVPREDLVVVVTAGNYKARNQGLVPTDILNRFVLPAVRDRR
jgi:CubicO group peptidase (beta-lactamase class C family)